MVPTNSFAVFLKNNDLEFRSLCIALCEYLNFPGSPEDIIQDLYFKFLTSEIIESFDPNYHMHGTKMSTYLYKIVKNFIVSKIKSNECRYFHQSVRNYEPSDDIDEVEQALCHNPVATDYVDILLYNESTDSSTGLGSDLKTFQRLLIRNRKNKKYMKKQKAPMIDFLGELKEELTELKHKEIGLDDPEYKEISERVKKVQSAREELAELKHKEVGLDDLEYKEINNRIEKVQADTGCTLTDIFALLYKGYSGKQIARVYGVSDMSVTNVKYKLGRALLNYGIKPAGDKSHDRIKMPKMSLRRGNRRV